MFYQLDALSNDQITASRHLKQTALPTGREDGAGGRELGINGVVGQQLCDSQLISTAANLSFFTE